MGDAPLGDVIEIEQLLARYAVAMTKYAIDEVVAVFTADGTYSAFGDTYRLGEFPRLVAAAPKGLFLVGPPALELDGDTGAGTQPLCFIDQTTHQMRIGYYTDTYRRTPDGWRLATRSMTFLRRNGSRDSGRPHNRRVRPLAPVDGGSPSSEGESRQLAGPARRHPHPPRGRPGCRDGPSGHGAPAHLRRRLGPLGVAQPGRRPGGLDAPARLPRRGPHRPRTGRAGDLLDDRDPGPDHDRLRTPRTGRGDGPPAPPGRRDLVSGVLRPRRREQPRLPVVPGGAGGWGAGR